MTNDQFTRLMNAVTSLTHTLESIEKKLDEIRDNTGGTFFNTFSVESKLDG